MVIQSINICCISLRCGVPDVSHAGYRNKRDADGAPLVRVKRYNLQGERWPRNNLGSDLQFGSRSDLMNQAIQDMLTPFA